MKLITPFTILNRKFNEMDLIRDAMKNRRLATERLHEDYRKMYKKSSICLLKISILFTLLIVQSVEHTFAVHDHSFVVGKI